MVTEAINTAIEAGAPPQNILVRGDSAYCAGKIIAAIVKAGATFSFAIARNPAVDAAINSIPDEAFVPVHYPGAVEDPDTGELISDAQVSKVEYTAFADTRHEITATLVVRRVLDANTQDPLFPVWRYHPFFTNNTAPVTQADITHREHAIVETVWSDLIDGPWAHQPSSSFAANAARCRRMIRLELDEAAARRSRHRVAHLDLCGAGLPAPGPVRRHAAPPAAVR
jgi:hypothetical protein